MHAFKSFSVQLENFFSWTRSNAWFLLICNGLFVWALTDNACAQHQLWKSFQERSGQTLTTPRIELLQSWTSAEPTLMNQWPVQRARCYTLRQEEISKLLQDRPLHFSMPLESLDGRILNLELTRHEVFGPDSRLLQPGDIPPQPILSEGLYYRGIVSGQPESLVALSIFSDEVAGVVSLPEEGNLVLGRLVQTQATEQNKFLHVLYADRELMQKPIFHCGSDEIPPTVSASSPDTIYSLRCKTVKIFLECDYKLYQDKNRSVTNVKNYVSSLFNVVKTLYYNENVNIEISDIMVWSSQDPFLHTDLASILYHYSNYRQNNFTGNLAQLVTTFAPQQQGGIAFLGTLCQAYNGQSGPHSFAYIYNSFSQLPSYSWSVEVMSHELGHNFGSPHTHACFWGPFRNQALDNCQPPENNACSAGPAPVGGGTVMSYCHLSGYGINFSKGFGDEPGEILRIAAQNRSCVAASFVPTIQTNINGPYIEDDVLLLKARPAQSSYQYDWFHYDYLLPLPKDSIFHVDHSGVYKVALSNQCTEYSAPDTVDIGDFLVNLGCPVIPGRRDSVSVGFQMIADLGTRRDSLVVPDSLYKKVPAWARDVLVVLDMTIKPNGTSWNRDVSVAYTGPAGTSISNSKFNPNAAEPAGYSAVKTYSRILGRFDPAGVWQFITNDNRPDAGIDGLVDFTIKIVWRAKDSVENCRIPLCEGQSITLDAGIRSAQYKWSTGATTRQVTVKDTGIISVEVSRGGKKASHTVEFYNYPRNYQQQVELCEGDSLKIGSRYVRLAGDYLDTLTSVTGCDSVLQTRLEVLKHALTRESLFLCYGDTFRGQSYTQSTVERFHFAAANGCDSIHEVMLHVHPELSLQTSAFPACPEQGGRLEAMASGGSGSNYTYRWTNGREGSIQAGLPSGNYRVSASDSSGCAIEKEVILTNLDSVGFQSLVFDVDCFGDQNGRIYLDFTSGRAPFHVLWSTQDTTKDLLMLPAATYTAYVSDANGCKSQRAIEVRSPELLFVQVDVFGSTGTDGKAKALVFGGTPPYVFLWSTGERIDSIAGLSPGMYQIWIEDQKGCKAQAGFEIPFITGLMHASDDDEWIIAPNPASKELWLMHTNDRSYTWWIRSMEGQTIMQGRTEGRAQWIDIRNLAAGAYWIEVRSVEQKHFRLRFMKL